MSTVRIAVLGLAIGSAGLAAFLAKGFVTPKPQTTRAIVAPVKSQTADVLVVTKDIPMGDPVDLDSTTWKPWPQDAVQPYMVTKAKMPNARKKFNNSRARSALYAGEPVIKRKLVLPGSAGFLAAILPKGMRAISVRISAETGAGGFILPNDRVDILLTRKEGKDIGGKSRSNSEVVLSNVRVLAVDQTLKTDSKGQQVVVGRTATVELLPRQAEVLATVETTGQLTLVLRSLADNGSTKLGDARPVLSKRYKSGKRNGELVIYRYGVPTVTSVAR